MKKWNKLFALLLAVVLVLSLAACGTGNTSNGGTTSGNSTSGSTTPANNSGDSGDAQQGGESEATGTKTFVFGSDANSNTFDVATDLQTNSARALVNSVMQTLWTVDNDGNVTDVLAESHEWTGDLELTVHLRQGVTYSNGNAFTSDDVLFNLEHLRDSGRTASMVACVDFDKTTCPDDYTIVIALSTYDAGFYDVMANNFLMDRETCEAEGWNYGWLYGTGPYKLKGDGVSDTSGWEESVQYTLVRNETYWGEAPYYDEIIIKFYSEESTRYAELQAGTLDAAYLTESSYVTNLSNGSVSGATLVQRNAQSATGLQIAAGKDTVGTFSDINLRKALAHGINIEEMVTVLGEGIYKVATSVLGEDNWAYENVGTYEYDPELAKECLEAAGYSVENPLTVTMVCESTALYTAMATQAQASLAEIGINLDLSGMGDFATILPVLLGGQQEIGFGNASNGAGNDPASLLQQFGPLSDNVLQRLNDDTATDLFNRGSASRDQAERIEIYKEYQEYIHDNYLFIPMWYETKNYGVLEGHTSFESALDTSNQLNPTLLTD